MCGVLQQTEDRFLLGGVYNLEVNTGKQNRKTKMNSGQACSSVPKNSQKRLGLKAGFEGRTTEK